MLMGKFTASKHKKKFPTSLISPIAGYFWNVNPAINAGVKDSSQIGFKLFNAAPCWCVLIPILILI